MNFKYVTKWFFAGVFVALLFCICVCVFGPWKTYQWEKDSNSFGVIKYSQEMPVLFGELLKHVNPTMKTQEESLHEYLKVVEGNLKTIEDRSGFTKDELLDEKNQKSTSIVYRIYYKEKLKTMKQIENLKK